MLDCLVLFFSDLKCTPYPALLYTTSLSCHWKQEVLCMAQINFASFSKLLKPQTSLVPKRQLQTLTILPHGSCTEIRRCSFEERGFLPCEAVGSLLAGQ